MEDYEEWKQKRVEAVTSPTGWLSVCGLFWLPPISSQSTHTFGSDTSNHITLPPNKNVPLFAGTLEIQTADNDTIILTTKEIDNLLINGNRITHDHEELLHDMKTSSPTLVQFVNSHIEFFLIKRNNKLAVRVRDKQSEKLSAFKGLELFPYHQTFAVIANFVPHNKIIQVPNILDDVIEYKSTGALEFQWTDGKCYTLDTVLESPQSTHLWIIFKDATSGKETYPMRFVHTNLPDSQNKVTLDFNKAFNPACAFTDFAACPLAPKQNILPFRIEAGEKKYAGSSH